MQPSVRDTSPALFYVPYAANQHMCCARVLSQNGSLLQTPYTVRFLVIAISVRSCFCPGSKRAAVPAAMSSRIVRVVRDRGDDDALAPASCGKTAD